MKKFFNTLAFATVLFFAAQSFSSNAYKEIDADDLVRMKKETKDLVIIDSRSGDWFDGVVIEGAKQLAVSDTNEENLSKFITAKDKAVVFYCTNTECPASAKAAHKAAELGYSKLFKYPGGIEDWKKRGLPTTTLAKQ